MQRDIAMTAANRFFSYLLESQKAVSSLSDQNLQEEYEKAVISCVSALTNGRRIFTAGNGGSFADALHIAGELVNYFTIPHQALPVIALGANGSILTSWSNDHNFEEQLAREFSAFGSKGDVLIAISTSGKSRNIHHLITKASEYETTVIALTSNEGKKHLPKCDIYLAVDSDSTPNIQEGHIVIYHALCKEIEFQISKNAI